MDSDDYSISSYMPYYNQSCNHTDSSPLGTAALVVTTIAFGVIFCVGVAGNTLVALVIWRQNEMRSSTNYFLLNLSVADMLVLLICVPAGLVETYNPVRGWPLGKFMCYFVSYSENLASNVSILTLLAIAVERYYVICTPFKAHYICTPRRTLLVCVLAWLVSALINIPLMMTMVYLPECQINGRPQYLCGSIVDEEWEVVYETATTMLFFLLPFMFLTIIYFVIAHTLRKHKTMMATIRDNESESGSVRSKPKEEPTTLKYEEGISERRHSFKGGSKVTGLLHNINCISCWASRRRSGRKREAAVEYHGRAQEQITELHTIAEQDNVSREDDLMLSALRSRDSDSRGARTSAPLQRQDTPRSWKAISVKEKPASTIYGSKVQRHYSSASTSSRSSRSYDSRGSAKSANVASSGHGSAISRRSHQRVILMLAIVVAVFFVCWMPVRLINLWGIYATIEQHRRLSQREVLIIVIICRVLVYLNSAINPVLYNLISTKFRAAFKSVLSCASIKRVRSHSSRSLSSTSSFRFTKKSVDHAC